MRNRRVKRAQKSSFVVKVTDTGREYLELVYNEAMIKNQGHESRELDTKPIVLSQPGNI